MWGRRIFAGLVLTIVASGATALDANMGNVSVTLPPPRGFCELSMSNTSDQRMLTIVTDVVAKSGNKLLAMSADCRQLADWRSGKRKLLDDYEQYQANAAMLDKPAPESVAQTCATLRTQGEQLLSRQLPDIKAHVESEIKNMKFNESHFIGVLAEDADACYGGLIQKMRAEDGTDKTQLTELAVLIVKGRSLFAYRAAVYENADTVSAVLAKLKVDVAALMAANRSK